MPILGQLERTTSLELKGRGFRIWAECSHCGHQRWVRKDKLISNFKTKLCRLCSNASNKTIRRNIPKGSSHYKWKGGKGRDGGYIFVRLQPDNFFYPMTRKPTGAIREHRLVMAKHLGRNLHSWELVHHKNGIRDDNRIVNLQLVSDTRHNQITILENKLNLLESENKALKSLLESYS